MSKKAPSTTQLLVITGFAFSCFGILLFMWITFGGPTPFKAKPYEIKIPFNAPPDRACEIVVDSGKDLYGGGHELLTFPVCAQYTIQGDLFPKAVIDGTEVPEPLEDSIRNMECIEAVFRSAESGRWERPGHAVRA